MFLSETSFTQDNDVSSEARDPIIDDGLSYFAKNKPYVKVLAKYGDQNEVSSLNNSPFIPTC